MNGIHDMGGMQDMGPVRAEKNEPVFHAPWEGRMFALDLAVDGDWPAGSGRYQRELIPPAEYLRISYYEKWYASLTELLVNYGFLTREELDSGKSAGPAKKTGHVMTGAEVAGVVAAGWPSTVDVKVDPRFHAGQRVRGRNINPPSHTRLPRYARGKIGTIAQDHGVFVFPDASAQGLGKKPQHVYSVRFGARELWGNQARARDCVYVAMWDDYLDPA
jgi:nitrile hydratase beta subunit